MPSIKAERYDQELPERQQKKPLLGCCYLGWEPLRAGWDVDRRLCNGGSLPARTHHHPPFRSL